MFLSGNRLQEWRQGTSACTRLAERLQFSGIVHIHIFASHSRFMMHSCSWSHLRISITHIHWWWQQVVQWCHGAVLKTAHVGVQPSDHLTPLSPRLTVFLWCSEFPSCLAPFEIGYNVEGLSTNILRQLHNEIPATTRRWQPHTTTSLPMWGGQVRRILETMKDSLNYPVRVRDQQKFGAKHNLMSRTALV